jgi:hypothetical protein
VYSASKFRFRNSALNEKQIGFSIQHPTSIS